MSFELLKQVIAHLRKKAGCPDCGMKLEESSVFVLSTGLDIFNESAHALFFIICPKCSSTAFITANLSGRTQANSQIPEDSIQIRSQRGPKITANDILDMHNFLQSWRGDVRELFN